MFKLSTTLVIVSTLLAALAPVRSAPTLYARHEGHDHSSTSSANSVQKNNALLAQKLNANFATRKATDSCNADEKACIDGAFAQCDNGKWALHRCAGGTRCYALPLVLKEGVSLACDTQEGSTLRFKEAGVTGGTKGTDPAEEPEEEIEDCEEGDEDEIEGRAFASDEHYDYFYKRQLESDTSSSAVTFATFSTTNLPTATALPSASSAFTSLPSTTEAAEASITSSPAVSTPTIVIGSDGIVTVTVVSTVFATPTDCANTPSSSSLPTAISVSRATPAASSSPIIISSSAATTTIQVPSSPVAPSSTLAPASSAAGAGEVVTVLSPASQPSATAAAAPVNNGGKGGIEIVY